MSDEIISVDVDGKPVRFPNNEDGMADAIIAILKDKDDRIANLEQRREADRQDFCRVTTERDRAQIDLLHIKNALFGDDCDYGSKTWQECVAEINESKTHEKRESSLVRLGLRGIKFAVFHDQCEEFESREKSAAETITEIERIKADAKRYAKLKSEFARNEDGVLECGLGHLPNNDGAIDRELDELIKLDEGEKL